MKDGKLFGKINIIDLIVLIAAVVIVAAVGLKLTGRAGHARENTGTAIHYTVQAKAVDGDVYESVRGYLDAAKAAGKPGDQLMASGELLNGYVTSVTAVPRPEEITVAVGGESVTVSTGERNRVDLLFEVDAYVENNIKTEVGTQEVRSGKNHILKTTHFELAGTTILDVVWEDGTGAGF